MAETRKAKRGRAPEDLISLPKAAAILKRHRQTVAHMAAREEVGAATIDGRLFISRADAERIAEEEREQALAGAGA